ncbi:uncharacterized protein [Dermacentor albipictus]|uniref:uncharacterized protein n=1 Tax=Dermacentor albipictus TaxID=60249 RepID=UPI0038FC24A3
MYAPSPSPPSVTAAARPTSQSSPRSASLAASCARDPTSRARARAGSGSSGTARHRPRPPLSTSLLHQCHPPRRSSTPPGLPVPAATLSPVVPRLPAATAPSPSRLCLGPRRPPPSPPPPHHRKLTPKNDGGVSQVHKNPFCTGVKPCLKEAENNIFEVYPDGKMDRETPVCVDMYGHVCTDQFINSNVDEQPMRFQSLYLVISNIMKFINESVDKDIGYPLDSALMQTMLFIKNCTSQDDRLKASKKSTFKSVFQQIGLQGFPFVEDTKQPLDGPTAMFSYLYIFPFFRVTITHKSKEGNSIKETYVTLFSEVVKFKIKTKSAKADTVRLLFLELKTNFEKYFPLLANVTDAILEESFSFIGHVRELSLSQAFDEKVVSLKDMPVTEGWNWVTFLNTMYDGIHTFTNDSQVILKNRPFFESFVSYIGNSSNHRRAALNYLGFFLLIYLMPLYPEELAEDQTLIGAKVHSPKDMSRRPQICMRRTEFTCPYGIPSLLAHVLANSTSLNAVRQNLTWWINDLKDVMKRFAGSIYWLDEEQTKLVREKITNMRITFIFPDMFLKAKPNIKDLKCGYKPDLYKQDPITHFIKAMFTGANASKSELKTKQPRPMQKNKLKKVGTGGHRLPCGMNSDTDREASTLQWIPVISNFEFAASYNPEENSLYAPMGLFGQILYAKTMEEKIFYTFKALPDIIREMSKVFMKRSFLSWAKTTAAKYADVERCMFDFYKDTVSDITFQVAEEHMEDLLESLLAEALMFHPLQEMYAIIKAKISKSDKGFTERGFGRYKGVHLFYLFLIETHKVYFCTQEFFGSIQLQCHSTHERLSEI